MFRSLGRWLWFFALACGTVGVYGLADLGTAEPAGKLLLVGPHAAGVAVAAGVGRRRAAAGLVAVAGSATMAGLSWVDALDRQAEGFEWRFNNALSGATFCVANWFVLAVVGCVALVLSDTAAAPATPLGAGPGEEGAASCTSDTMMCRGIASRHTSAS